LSNPVIDQERVAFLAARTPSRKMLVPAWPRQIKELPMVEVEVNWVRFSTLNHRTKAEQLKAIHLANKPDLFSADPLGKAAQQAQYKILSSQAGFADLKIDLQERQQQEPAILTAEGVLINGNRRSAALRSLYNDDDHLAARYVQCLVLPEDALPDELVDLEAELQVAQTFKEDYSWVNEAMLIEELYEREHKDWPRVAKKMHRKPSDVKSLYEKLQQLHQLVALSKGARLHIDFNENESAFDELAKHIRGKQKLEAESVRATYFLGTLAGVNYRTLRHLQRPDAADMVLREIAADRALEPLLDTIAASTDASEADDPLDELLGEESKPGDLVGILGFLAAKDENEVIKFSSGTSASVRDIYSTIRSAVTSAANEAKEEDSDHSAVTAPIIRAENAIGELKRAVAAAPKARRFDEWNEKKLQEKVAELRELVDELAPK
jgi:hypothetical protein